MAGWPSRRRTRRARGGASSPTSRTWHAAEAALGELVAATGEASRPRPTRASRSRWPARRLCLRRRDARGRRDERRPSQAVIDVAAAARGACRPPDFADDDGAPAGRSPRVARSWISAALAEAAGDGRELAAVTTAGAALVAEPDGSAPERQRPVRSRARRRHRRASFASAASRAASSTGCRKTRWPSWSSSACGRPSRTPRRSAGRAGGRGGRSARSTPSARWRPSGSGIDLDADVLPLLDREVGVAVSGIDGGLPIGQMLLRPTIPMRADAAAAARRRSARGDPARRDARDERRRRIDDHRAQPPGDRRDRLRASSTASSSSGSVAEDVVAAVVRRTGRPVARRGATDTCRRSRSPGRAPVPRRSSTSVPLVELLGERRASTSGRRARYPSQLGSFALTASVPPRSDRIPRRAHGRRAVSRIEPVTQSTQRYEPLGSRNSADARRAPRSARPIASSPSTNGARATGARSRSSASTTRSPSPPPSSSRREKIKAWIGKGALPSDTVAKLMRQAEQPRSTERRPPKPKRAPRAAAKPSKKAQAKAAAAAEHRRRRPRSPPRSEATPPPRRGTDGAGEAITEAEAAEAEAVARPRRPRPPIESRACRPPRPDARRGGRRGRRAREGRRMKEFLEYVARVARRQARRGLGRGRGGWRRDAS